MSSEKACTSLCLTALFIIRLNDQPTEIHFLHFLQDTADASKAVVLNLGYHGRVEFSGGHVGIYPVTVDIERIHFYALRTGFRCQKSM